MSSTFFAKPMHYKRFVASEKIARDGNMAKCLMDLKRDIDIISFNGKSLSDLVIAELNLYLTIAEIISQTPDKNKAKEEIDSLIQEKITEEALGNIIKGELLSTTTDPALQEKQLNALSSILHQEGILYPVKESMADNVEVADQGHLAMHDDMESKLNIFTNKKGIIRLDEHCSLKKLSNASLPSEASLENEDGSPLLEIKSRCAIKFTKNKMQFRHEDLTIQANNKEAEGLYDKRSFLTRVRNFIEDLFGRTSIKGFSVQAAPQAEADSANNAQSEADAQRSPSPGRGP